MNLEGGKPISELPPAESVRPTDLVIIVQDGVTKRATVAQVFLAAGIDISGD